MFAKLGTSNLTLDGTDLASLAPLYSATSGLTASALLAQPMASLDGISPAVVTSRPGPPAGTGLTIAPGALNPPGKTPSGIQL